MIVAIVLRLGAIDTHVQILKLLLNELGDKAETLGNASAGYGLGNWYLYNGDKEKAIEIFRRIVAGNQWASFGYIAAEAELAR